MIGIATTYAQDADPDATGSFSELKVKPSDIKFKEIDLSSGGTSESKSFTVTDSGTASLTVTVDEPGSSSTAFRITQGAGQTPLQPKGELTVTIEFEPSTAGKFSATIAVSSEATKGKTSTSVKVTGSAKGALAPTPTATPTGMGGTPTATPSATRTPTPTATATVSARNSIFVTNFAAVPQLNTGDSVTSYPVTVSGNSNIAPSININGSNPALFEPSAIALDSRGNIYVVNMTGGLSGNGSVTEYAAGNNGNAMPIATISGPDTGLDDPQFIALDSQANIYVTNYTGTLGPIDGGGITVYPAGSNGDVTPSATIYSSTESSGSLLNPTGIAVDQASGNIFVVTEGGGCGDGCVDIVEYPPGSNGAATPTAVIVGSNTGLGTDTFLLPEGLALNPVNGDIYVAGVGGIILAFPAGSSGNVQPEAAIEGPATGLDFSIGVALDSSGTIYVANALAGGFGSITVYPPGSNFNVTPSATIEGSNTLLSGPYGIAVGP